MILTDPGGGLNFDGASLDSPERVVFSSPDAGVWTIDVQGFTVHGDLDDGDSDSDSDSDAESEWELRVTADGVRVDGDDDDGDSDSD